MSDILDQVILQNEGGHSHDGGHDHGHGHGHSGGYAGGYGGGYSGAQTKIIKVTCCDIINMLLQSKNKISIEIAQIIRQSGGGHDGGHSGGGWASSSSSGWYQAI